VLISISNIFAQQLTFNISESVYAPFEPNFDIDSSGHFIAVWQDLRHSADYEGDEDGSAIYIQKFDMNGFMLGVNVRVDDKEIISSKTWPDISIDKRTGDVVFVWQKRITIDGKRKSMIVGKILNSDLEPNTSEFIVETDDSTRQAFPQVTYLDNSNILIMWFENHEDQYYYFAKMLNKYGAPITNRIMANANNKPGLVCADVLPSTGFFFVWDCYLIIYDNFFSPVTDVIEMPVNSINSVKSLSENKILIVYRTDNESQLWGVIFNVVENTFSVTFRIDDDNTYSYNTRAGSDIAVTKSGDFIVVWGDPRNDNKRQYDVWDIYGQRFDNNAQLIGVNFKINHEDLEIEQHNPKTLFCNNYFITIFNQGLAVVGSSQNFEHPIPGPIYGWEYFLSPEHLFLNHPYPNPFIYHNHDFITFEFGFNNESKVCLEIFNILGQKVKRLFSGDLDKGYYKKKWYGDAEKGHLVAPGVYICRLKIGNEIIYKKLVII